MVGALALSFLAPKVTSIAKKAVSGGGAKKLIQGFAPQLGPSMSMLSPRAPAARGRRGKPGTTTGMIAMPARMPTKRQFKKINKRLHDWRGTAISIVNRTGGMKPRRTYRGPKRRARR